jgi:hypothetical protein
MREISRGVSQSLDSPLYHVTNPGVLERRPLPAALDLSEVFSN